MIGRIIKIIPLFLLLWLTVPGCSSLDEYYNKGKRVHKSVTSLELGMTKSEVLKVMRYGPDFVNKEALDEGVREILVYRGSYQPYGWMSEPVPMVYHLVIENGVERGTERGGEEKGGIAALLITITIYIMEGNVAQSAVLACSSRYTSSQSSDIIKVTPALIRRCTCQLPLNWYLCEY